MSWKSSTSRIIGLRFLNSRPLSWIKQVVSNGDDFEVPVMGVVPMVVQGDGSLDSEPTLETPTSAFGEFSMIQNTPQVQVKFSAGLNTRQVKTNANGVGSTVTSKDGYAEITCPALPSSLSHLLTRDTIRYGVGQGAIAIYSAAWLQGGVDKATQFVGPGDGSEGLFFGFDGVDFGIIRKSLGMFEVRTLTISNVATGSGDIVITIDGDPITVSISSGWTVAQTVEQIISQTSLFSNASRGWFAHSSDDKDIQFVSFIAAPATQSFSFSGGTTGVAGVFSVDFVGVEPSEHWIKQSEWNKDPMDGSGPSGMILDHTMLTVYKIQFQYLGVGRAKFKVETTPGVLADVHYIEYANTAQIPFMRNPTLELAALIDTNPDYVGEELNIRTSSLGGFIEGKEGDLAIKNTVSISKTATTTENVLLILYNQLVYNLNTNKIAVHPTFAAISTDTAKAVIITIYKNPTRIDGGSPLTHIDSSSSVMQFGTDGTTFNGGEIATVLQVPASGSINIPLDKLVDKLAPGDRWLITTRVSSGASDIVNASISWDERI